VISRMHFFPLSQSASPIAVLRLCRRDRGDRKHATVLAMVALSTALIASKPARAADLAAGKALAESCTGCHGADGISQTPKTPSLAGQPDEFIQWQLVYFRSGTRKDQAMQPIAESLETNDVRNLGAYFASLPSPNAPTAQDPGTEAGAKLAAQHRCTFCHGEHYEGNKAVARLAGQREDYLYKALSDFKSGARTGSGVASMADVVYSLQDNDLKLLAHYIATQP
jgi:cytochrome c553